MADRLFSLIERLHGDSPWGEVLDAGAGEHSLRWLRGRAPRRLVAVTAGVNAAMREAIGEGELVIGNWTDEALLSGQRFDVVLADYLLGAIDGFAPYFQDQLFGRLHRHVGGVLYVVGLDPLPEATVDPGQRIILDINRMRDACILLAGHRCYREYPMEWTVRSLESSGFRVEAAERVPILFGERYVRSQLGVCERKLPYFADRGLAESMRSAIAALRERALAALATGQIRYGSDYVVAARPR